MMQNGLFGHKEHVYKVSAKSKNTKIIEGRFGRELLCEYMFCLCVSTHSPARNYARARANTSHHAQFEENHARSKADQSSKFTFSLTVANKRAQRRW